MPLQDLCTNFLNALNVSLFFLFFFYLFFLIWTRFEWKVSLETKEKSMTLYRQWKLSKKCHSWCTGKRKCLSSRLLSLLLLMSLLLEVSFLIPVTNLSIITTFCSFLANNPGILEEGLIVPGIQGSVSYITFESNLAFVLRFMIDQGIINWPINIQIHSYLLVIL